MDRVELIALRGAIDQVLTWSDQVRDQVAQWLAAESPRPNGRDPHPPPTAPAGNGPATPRRPPIAFAGKARRGAPPPAAKAEERLLAALRDHPGSSVSALAKTASASRTRTAERLRGLASRGVVTKDDAGHWRLVEDLAGEEAAPGTAARPREAPPSN
jgi:hypothetical protein